jgi:protein-tyrosine phosphatase
MSSLHYAVRGWLAIESVGVDGSEACGPVRLRGAAASANLEKKGRTTVSSDTSTRSDPLTRRMTGVTIGGFDLSDVPLISEIVPGLWQGGSADWMVLPEFIAHFVSLSRRKPCTVAHDLVTQLARRMTDSAAQDMSVVDPVARWVNDCRETGPVLVQCAAGLNRSGLVVARALTLGGMTAEQAITLIRARRSPACLRNEAFEGWLRGLPPEGRRDAALAVPGARDEQAALCPG